MAEEPARCKSIHALRTHPGGDAPSPGGVQPQARKNSVLMSRIGAGPPGGASGTAPGALREECVRRRCKRSPCGAPEACVFGGCAFFCTGEPRRADPHVILNKFYVCDSFKIRDGGG
ncbi:unnamed protein product [Prorocentrum cordatum]|uniref:SREBP regulating gene protein n=1 Tax=Prorocentrum cordatum TaxID=2364126 RepID=A0ABN9RAV4_9DINO|nr:unnamed protein product [Polarella glacialis]